MLSNHFSGIAIYTLRTSSPYLLTSTCSTTYAWFPVCQSAIKEPNPPSTTRNFSLFIKICYAIGGAEKNGVPPSHHFSALMTIVMRAFSFSDNVSPSPCFFPSRVERSFPKGQRRPPFPYGKERQPDMGEPCRGFPSLDCIPCGCIFRCICTPNAARWRSASAVRNCVPQ